LNEVSYSNLKSVFLHSNKENKMKHLVKNILKDKFLITKIRNRFQPSTQIAQRQLFHYYRDCIKNKNLPKVEETGYRVFSQFEEDGKLLFIFSILGMTNKTFIEIGSDDGVNSNSANLYFNFGWNGLFIDGNSKSIKRGQKFFSKYPHPWFDKPQFICSMVKRENINDLIRSANIEGEIGLLSIDIDGNDYWVWDAIDVVQPQVVIIETHNEFGMNNIVVPYDPNYYFPGKHPVYHGASPVAMNKLAKKKGYRLVGANEYGFNFIFVKNGLADDLIPEVSVESVLTHPSVKEGYKKFEEIKDWEYLEG
jgi:mRNA-degrading endonuclease RelE of RelBE toxin-antitoxin system